MTPAQYEDLVAEFIKEISSAFMDMDSAVLGFGATNKIKGASTFKHQIDVSLMAGRWLVLVECKRWEKRVGVQEVLVLASRLADIKKAISPEQEFWTSLVTKKGASSNALKLASHFGINIDCVRSPSEYAMRLRSQIHVGMSEGVKVGAVADADVIRGPIK